MAYTKTINQFRPTSLLNMGGNMFWGYFPKGRTLTNIVISMLIILFKRMESLESLDALKSVLRFGDISRVPGRRKQI